MRDPGEADCDQRPSFARVGGSLIWLLFIVLPLAGAVAHRHRGMSHGLEIAGAAAIVVLYMAAVIEWRRHPTERRRRVLLFVAGLYALAFALTLGDGPGWGYLFTYCVAVAAICVPRGWGVPVTIASAALAAAASSLGGGNGGMAFSASISTAGIGLVMVVMGDLRHRNAELVQARAELARLAVAEERQRFARDLHDLLGHSLSVIALKAELAGRLMGERPDRAAREIAQVEEVARAALGEVREAVSGYRELTLEGELAGARMALSAAGIAAEVQPGELALPVEVESVLAWAVREGATNVIRHSQARNCRLRIGTAVGGGVELEVCDDGIGTPDARASSAGDRGDKAARRGHGLLGLAERLEPVGGTLEAGAAAGGGFRVLVRVPTGADVVPASEATSGVGGRLPDAAEASSVSGGSR